MNEKFLELAKQAGLKFPSETALSPMEEKFAGLIVKEYEKLLPENCSWNGPADSPMKGWHVAFVARKHFGLDK